MSTEILCTCPPMIAAMDRYEAEFARHKATCFCPEIRQELSEQELLELVPKFDGWIIGDDPATRQVLEAGVQGRLKAAARWGVGVDNVDFDAARDLGLAVPNTPGVFNEEVSDVAVGYAIGLIRHLFEIDRGVRAGAWPKPPGRSLNALQAAVVGYGNIGRSTCRKLAALGLQVTVHDPFLSGSLDEGITGGDWPGLLAEADLLVLTCALTPESRHLVNRESLAGAKTGLRIVNVARGPVIDETALVEALTTGLVSAAALDVMEIEPLETDSPLRKFDQCVFGSHNASNTRDAVDRTSMQAIELLFGQLQP